MQGGGTLIIHISLTHGFYKVGVEPTIERFLNNNIIVTLTHSLHGRLGNSQIDQGCFSLSGSGEPHSLSYRVTQLVKMLIALGDSLCKTLNFLLIWN